MNKRMFSKAIAILLMISIALFLASCGKTEEVPSSDPAPPETTVPDNGEGSGSANSSPSPKYEDMIPSLKEILEDIDKKRKEGSASAPDGQDVPSESSMILPLESMQFISRGFIAASHHGIDFVAQAGTEVYAAFDGFVAGTGFDETLGNYVILEHGGEILTVYSHLKSFTAEKETYVKQGDMIGYVGATGNATGPHLDFRVVSDNSETDPSYYLVPGIMGLDK